MRGGVADAPAEGATLHEEDGAAGFGDPALHRAGAYS